MERHKVDLFCAFFYKHKALIISIRSKYQIQNQRHYNQN
jgi:hypothetical protein